MGRAPLHGAARLSSPRSRRGLNGQLAASALPTIIARWATSSIPSAARKPRGLRRRPPPTRRRRRSGGPRTEDHMRRLRAYEPAHLAGLLLGKPELSTWSPRDPVGVSRDRELGDRARAVNAADAALEPSVNQTLESGPTVSDQGLTAAVGRANSVTAPAIVIRVDLVGVRFREPEVSVGAGDDVGRIRVGCRDIELDNRTFRRASGRALTPASKPLTEARVTRHRWIPLERSHVRRNPVRHGLRSAMARGTSAERVSAVQNARAAIRPGHSASRECAQSVFRTLIARLRHGPYAKRPRVPAAHVGQTRNARPIQESACPRASARAHRT